MNPNELALWVMGALFTVVTSIGLIVLRIILQQGRDTNEKVTEQGNSIARVEEASRTSANEIAQLRLNQNEITRDIARMAGARELAEAIVHALDDRLERRRERRGGASR